MGSRIVLLPMRRRLFMVTQRRLGRGEAVSALWRELLRVERVGRHDNFFELGGDPLLAPKVIERLRRSGCTPTCGRFLSPTVSELSAHGGE